jgi:hypothetical protein
MAELVDLAERRKALRDQLAKEIVHANKNPESHPAADRLLASLSEVLATAPLAEEEKLLALYTKLVEGLASIENEGDRKYYADEFAKYLRQDVVESAVQAFREIR